MENSQESRRHVSMRSEGMVEARSHTKPYPLSAPQAFEILPDKPPRDYMCLSILAFFLCFPIGIVALIFSIQVGI